MVCSGGAPGDRDPWSGIVSQRAAPEQAMASVARDLKSARAMYQLLLVGMARGNGIRQN